MTPQPDPDPTWPRTPRRWRWLIVGILIVWLAALVSLAFMVSAALTAGAAHAAEAVAHDAAPLPTSDLVLKWTLGVVALANLVLSVSTWHAARLKAAASRLETLESLVRDRLREHDEAVIRLEAAVDAAVTHDHLAEVYRDIKTTAAQVHTLVGQQGQATDLLRQLLAQQLRH
ncbi:MAG: hypothetical protein JNL87_12985 [Burkholderiaceae bacterium]|nr:hypothetical protein [Burkholderiaceae bacterium]